MVNFTFGDNITFEQLKCDLYRYMSILERDFNLKVRVRFNTSNPPIVLFFEILNLKQ